MTDRERIEEWRKLAFVAIRDGENWNDRRLPEIGRALDDVLDALDAAEQEKRAALDAVWLPHTASIDDLTRHHRLNAEFAAGFKVRAAEQRAEEAERKTRALEKDANAIAGEANAETIRRVRAEARCRTLTEALQDIANGDARIVYVRKARAALAETQPEDDVGWAYTEETVSEAQRREAAYLRKACSERDAG